MSTSCPNEGTSQGNQSSNHQYLFGCPALKKGRGSPQPLCLPTPPAAWCRKNTATGEKKERRIVEVRSLGYSITVGGHLYVRRTPSEEEMYAKFMKPFDSRITALWSKATSENVLDTLSDDTDAPDDDAETPYDDAEIPDDNAEIPDDDEEILHNDGETPNDDAKTLSDDEDTTNNDLETPGDNPNTPKHDSDAPVADIPIVYLKQIGFYDSEESLDEVELNKDEDSSRSASPKDSIGSTDAADQRSSDRSDALKPNALPRLAHIWNGRIFCPQCGRQLKIPTPSYV